MSDQAKKMNITLTIKQITSIMFISGLLAGLALTYTATTITNTKIINPQTNTNLVEAQETNNTQLNLNNVNAGRAEGTIEWEGGNITLENKPYLGSSTARFKLITYEDFDCSFCGQYNRNGFKTILNNQIKNGEIQYFYKHYNTQQGIGKTADQATQCALNQRNKAFWKMKQKIYQNQKQLNSRNIKQETTEYAEQLNLDTKQFQSCIENQETLNRRQADQKEAENFTTQFPRGTPALILYDTKTGITKTMHGERNKETLQKEINSITV